LWRRDSGELFYWSATGETTGQIMGARVEAGASFTSGAPQRVLARSYLAPTPGRGYDVSLDGQRFLVIKDAPVPTALPSELVVVLNWGEELKRLVPTK